MRNDSLSEIGQELRVPHTIHLSGARAGPLGARPGVWAQVACATRLFKWIELKRRDSNRG